MSDDENSIYSVVGANEFEPPTPLRTHYCLKISEEQYEDQAQCETEKALEDLISYLEKEPEALKKVLKKRKQEEMEQCGVLSFLKIKLMKSIQGEKYSGDSISEEEYLKKVEDLKNGMIMAYSYAQETKGRRFSNRLAVKRQRHSSSEDDKENVGTPKIAKMAAVTLPPIPSSGLSMKVPRVPPPPPPCPPPALTPLKERNLTSTPYMITVRPPLRKTGSMESIHQELKSYDHLQRLKNVNKTPGVTPREKALARSKNIFGSTNSLNGSFLNPLDSSEPLSRAFIRIMEQKFKNVRTPSPLVHSAEQTFNTTASFTP